MQSSSDSSSVDTQQGQLNAHSKQNTLKSQDLNTAGSKTQLKTSGLTKAIDRSEQRVK